MPREDTRIYLLPEFSPVYVACNGSDGEALVIRTSDKAIVDTIDVGQSHAY